MMLVVLLQLMPQYMVAQENGSNARIQTGMFREVRDQKILPQNAFLSEFEKSLSNYFSIENFFDLSSDFQSDLQNTQFVFVTQSVQQIEATRQYLPMIFSWNSVEDQKTLDLFRNLTELRQQIKRTLQEQGYNGPIGLAIIKLDWWSIAC